MLLRRVYKNNLVALVIDEAHCVQTWGEDFSVAFASIRNLCSIILSNVKIMALTVTATQLRNIEDNSGKTSNERPPNYNHVSSEKQHFFQG